MLSRFKNRSAPARPWPQCVRTALEVVARGGKEVREPAHPRLPAVTPTGTEARNSSTASLKSEGRSIISQ